MKSTLRLFGFIVLLGSAAINIGCHKEGCPAEIQARKIKKKDSLKKGQKTELFSKKMRKNIKNPKF